MAAVSLKQRTTDLIADELRGENITDLSPSFISFL